MNLPLPEIRGIRRPGALVAGGLLLVAFSVRAWGLTRVGLWHDEALSHFYALQPTGWLLAQSASELNHPPLFFLILRGWLGIVPPYDPLWVELLNVAFGTLTVAVTGWWGRLFLDRATTLIVVLLLALHPWAVHFSGELRMYALAGLAVTVSGYFATRLLMNAREGPAGWAGWVLACLVCLYTHSFAGFFVLVQVPFVLVLGAGSPVRRAGAVLLVLGLYAPWGIHVLGQVSRITADYWLPPFRWYYPVVLLFLALGWIGSKVPGPGTLVRGLVLLSGAGVPLVRGALGFRDRLNGLLLGLVVVPLLVVTGWSLFGQSVFLYRVFSPLVPAFLLLLGRGYELLEARHAYPLLILYLLFLGWELVGYRTHPPRQYVRAVASGIQQRTASRHPVVHTSPYSYYPSRFYHRNRPDEVLLVEESPPGDHTVDRGELDGLLRRGPVLLVYPGRRPPAWVRSTSYRVRERRCWEEERTFCSVVLEKYNQ